MPAILTTPEECDQWMTGSIPEALALQRPLADSLLSVVAVGPREDGLAPVQPADPINQPGEPLLL